MCVSTQNIRAARPTITSTINLPMDNHMLKSSICAALLLASGIAIGADAQREASRGELLYSTHCIGCHGAQIH